MNKYILNVCSITARIKVSRLLIRIYLVSTRKQIELEWNITGFSHKVLTWYFFTGLSNKIYVFPVNVVVIAESRQDRPKFVRFFSFSLHTMSMSPVRHRVLSTHCHWYTDRSKWNVRRNVWKKLKWIIFNVHRHQKRLTPSLKDTK